MSLDLRKLSWYVIPILCAGLSLPILWGILAGGALLSYGAITGQTGMLFFIENLLHPPLLAPFLFYIIFVPILACVFCTLQLAHYEQKGSAAPGNTVHRISVAALLLAVLTLGSYVLLIGILGVLRGGT